ncbi:MAG: hypothetical protein ACPG77_10250 [Nannocystaceae bacterium]
MTRAQAQVGPPTGRVSGAVAHAVGASLVPADWIRRKSLQSLRGWVRPLVRNRDLRIVVTGMAMLCTSLAGAWLIPLWILALGPLVLGVPHILGDLRHLVVRPGFHRRAGLWLVAGLPILATGLGADTRFGVLGILGVALVARASVGRRLAVGIGALALGLGFHALGDARDLYFAHAHNFIAIGLWWWWRPRRSRLHWWVLVGFAAICGLIMSDFGWSVLLWTQALVGSAGAMDTSYQLARLAPGVEFVLATKLVILYTFCQSMHYGVWIKLVPDEDRARPTPPPFRRAFWHLWHDLGGVLMLVALGLCLVLAGWAIFDLMAANHGYFRVVRFHGYLELCAVALFILEGRSSEKVRAT